MRYTSRVPTTRTRMQLRTLATVVALSCAITPVFNVFTNPKGAVTILQGVADAFFVSLLVAGYLLFVRDGVLRTWLRRWNFATNLVLNSVVLLVLFLAGRSLAQALTRGRWSRAWESLLDPHLAYALPFFVVCSFVMMFVLQMNRMVGTNVLRYFVAGIYHRPVNEERVFLFLDLEGSTRLAERLGSAAYYALLRRFVDDLSTPIVESGGEIYQYAGDEVVITWCREAGLRDASCVRCFFAIRDAIARGAASYRRDFGVVPRFRAGLHAGPVIAGELGDLKQQIVFVGDILNTAARLEEYAKAQGLELVASADVVERIELPPEVVARRLDPLRLRGKETPVAVYSLAAGTTGGAAAAGVERRPES